MEGVVLRVSGFVIRFVFVIRSGCGFTVDTSYSDVCWSFRFIRLRRLFLIGGG